MSNSNDKISFGSMVATSANFSLDFESDKDLPALNCVDLFPNSPKAIEADECTAQDILAELNTESNLSIASSTQKIYQEGNEQSPYNNFIEEDNSNTSRPNSRNHTPNGPTSGQESREGSSRGSTAPSPSHSIPQAEGDETSKAPSENSNSLPTGNGSAVSGTKTLVPVVSPSLSLSSYCSSAESVSSATSPSKQKKQRKHRHCKTCDLYFKHKCEFLNHLKAKHVSMPSVTIEKMNDEDLRIKEYLENLKSVKTSAPEESPEKPENAGNLKLKLKLSGTQNFKVIPFERLAAEPKKPDRILTAQEIKTSPSSSPTRGSVDPMLALSNMQPKNQENSILENKYFECPTLDGLDQFAEEVNNEAAEELLKKLLEGQQMTQENEWSSQPPATSNEFISIDRLAHICTICHCNFPDAMRLYEHRRITGHDFYPHQMNPPPPPLPHMNMQHRHAYPPQRMPGYSGHAVRFPPNFPYQQQYSMHGPGGPRLGGQRLINMNLAPGSGRPPPYKVPGQQPTNMAPFAEMSPEMYIPTSNGSTSNGGSPQYHPPGHLAGLGQMSSRHPIFLKARLQRPNMHSGNPNNTPSPPMIMGHPTATRPRFLGPPFHGPPSGPPLKRIKMEPGTEGERSSPRMDGLPIIQSVQGGAIRTKQDAAKEHLHGNDQVSVSMKNNVNKNSKEIANVLANRGITVTHKPKLPTGPLSRELSSKSNNSAQEAVQKLQLNNSVSIISKKRPHEADGRSESAFISCPVADCDEKFLTQEGLNRHTQRGHRMGKLNLKAFRCRVCPALFSTQEGLVDHQIKNHRICKTSADELGIPIIDLRNELTKHKLAALGIVNYIPLNSKNTNNCYGFPIVSVQGAANPNICNVLGIGVNSLLSLGPVKQIQTIPMRPPNHMPPPRPGPSSG